MLSRIVPILVAFALAAAACSPTSIEAEPQAPPTTAATTVATTTTVEHATSERATTSTTTPATTDAPTPTTTTTTAAVPAGGTIDNPLPLGNSSVSGFRYSERFADVEWTGSVEAMVTGTSGQFNDDPGQCFYVLGTLTPTDTGDGVVTNGFSTPAIGAMVAGQYIEDSISNCDRDPVDAAGYGWILDAAVTTGTSYHWFAEIFVPEGAGEIDLIVVGDPSGDQSLFFAPKLADTMPEPMRVVGPSVAETHGLTPTLAPFTYEGGFGSTEWNGQIHGVFPVENGQFLDEPGICVAVVGVFTPTRIDDGVVTSGFDAPDVGLIAAGHEIDSETRCDRSSLEAAGYGWRLDAEVAVGTAFEFYETYLLTDVDGPETIEAVTVGSASSDTFLLYEPTLLDALP